jgi:outer membrane lipoprotein carrier protein
MVIVKYSFLIGISLLSNFFQPEFARAGAGAETFLQSVSAPAQMAKLDREQSKAVTELLQLLVNLDGLKAKFQQTLLNADGHSVDQSSGYLLLAAPNLRWHIENPFTQIVVVRKNKLRIYDPDLAQVIEKNFSDSVSGSPLQLLINPQLLAKGNFIVSRIGSVDRQQFLLQPVSKQSLFAFVRLVFKSDELVELEIADHADQRTSIVFCEIMSGVKIPPGKFELDLPVDTDIVQG